MLLKNKRVYIALLKKVKKDNTPIAWTEDTQSSFESCKRLIANVTELSFPAADASMSLVTDPSDFSVGVILKHHIESTVEPLGFFSRNLSATEKIYSTFDRELLSIYLSVKYFRYMLEGIEVAIYTDHKPLILHSCENTTTVLLVKSGTLNLSVNSQPT
ncbi:hypothetical protein AVEN_187367-1 [Araneus ventricosus]|uniref:Reverse transcriptase/retrotransposon-derived protein RNase H-like domain-containing protein n=1 Tax=Araneus ventricosus TaxID=182803 RepID=A0A4Y2KDY0_ARAVE|nr:hypothetical protein AVEN_187367-1 [Araneus ventricosus]